MDAFSIGMSYFMGQASFNLFTSYCFCTLSDMKCTEDSMNMYIGDHVFWRLMGYSFLGLIISISLLFGLESLLWWGYKFGPKLGLSELGPDGELTHVTKSKMALINEWYTGTWAWALAYHWWMTYYSLLSYEYLGGYETKWAWWLVTTLLLAVTLCIIYILYGENLYAAGVLEHLSDTCHELRCSLKERINQALGMEMKVSTPGHLFKERLVKFALKNLKLISAVGVYFSSRKTFAGFNNALLIPAKSHSTNGTSTNPWGFWAGATMLYTTMLILTAIAKEHVKRWVTKGGDQTEMRFKKILLLNERVFEIFELIFTYNCGKAWQSVYIGSFPDAWCWCWSFWPVMVLVVSLIAGGFSWLHMRLLQIKDESNTVKIENPCCGTPSCEHGELCVCVACSPELYTDLPGVSMDKQNHQCLEGPPFRFFTSKLMMFFCRGETLKT